MNYLIKKYIINYNLHVSYEGCQKELRFFKEEIKYEFVAWLSGVICTFLIFCAEMTAFVEQF